VKQGECSIGKFDASRASWVQVRPPTMSTGTNSVMTGRSANPSITLPKRCANRPSRRSGRGSRQSSGAGPSCSRSLIVMRYRVRPSSRSHRHGAGTQVRTGLFGSLPAGPVAGGIADAGAQDCLRGRVRRLTRCSGPLLWLGVRRRLSLNMLNTGRAQQQDCAEQCS
jgi:hypothetical protein